MEVLGEQPEIFAQHLREWMRFQTDLRDLAVSALRDDLSRITLNLSTRNFSYYHFSRLAQ
jgi:hypothetical protein